MKGFLQRILQDCMKKIILGTSDTWSTSRLSHRPTEPAYYIVDWRISNLSVKSYFGVFCSIRKPQSLIHFQRNYYFLFAHHMFHRIFYRYFFNEFFSEFFLRIFIQNFLCNLKEFSDVFSLYNRLYRLVYCHFYTVLTELSKIKDPHCVLNWMSSLIIKTTTLTMME